MSEQNIPQIYITINVENISGIQNPNYGEYIYQSTLICKTKTHGLLQKDLIGSIRFTNKLRANLIVLIETFKIIKAEKAEIHIRIRSKKVIYNFTSGNSKKWIEKDYYGKETDLWKEFFSYADKYTITMFDMYGGKGCLCPMFGFSKINELEKDNDGKYINPIIDNDVYEYMPDGKNPEQIADYIINKKGSAKKYKFFFDQLPGYNELKTHPGWQYKLNRIVDQVHTIIKLRNYSATLNGDNGTVSRNVAFMPISIEFHCFDK